MRTGFLRQPESAKAAPPAAAAHPTVATAASSGPPPPGPEQQRTPEQVAAGLAECLELLKGPTDERRWGCQADGPECKGCAPQKQPPNAAHSPSTPCRFVGLLLITKLLPAGDTATVCAVHAAVGPTFLPRLLLPLRSGSAPLASAEAAQKAAGSCALGLAVLASFAHVPELAASEEVLCALPLLLNVVRAGGLGAALATAAAPGGSALGRDAIADAAVVQDVLECVVAAARSGREGRTIAADCGALLAAAAVLRHSPPVATHQLSLALQLLAALLADDGQRAQLQSGEKTRLACSPAAMPIPRRLHG